jgi:hypothetical protein
MTTMTGNGGMKAKRTLGEDILRVAIGPALVLLVPLVAMQFTSEVNWGPEDFAAIGVLLGSTGMMYVAVSRNVTSNKYRALVGAGLVLAVLLIWVEMAVGVFGSPIAGS